MDDENYNNSSGNRSPPSGNEKVDSANAESALIIGDEEEDEKNEFNVDLFEVKDKNGNKEVAEDPPRNQGAKLNNQLEEFRQQWHVELQNRPGSGGSSPLPPLEWKSQENSNSAQSNLDLEEVARNFFIQGMQAEDDGQLAEAIYYYKKALQLVPDIESKLGNIFSPGERIRQDSVSSVDESEIEEDLLLHIENLRVDDDALCQPKYEQRATHFSSLPVELVTYILQWVVSADLDLKSLEMFSAVCRGFFSCARDERLWKMACERIWGINLGKAKKYGGSWRRMMIERPHLLFSGCYISRMSYVRQGEQSLDQFYRPFHLVEYYRYARFFPDGIVLMLVSPEEPIQSLPKLRFKNSKSPGILRGGYKVSDSKVTCVLKRVRSEQVQNNRYKRQRKPAIQNEIDTTYYAEFDLASVKNKQNAQITWLKYTISTIYKGSGEENVTNFDLDKKTFPPLIFSQVRSYTAATTEPLTHL